MPTVVSDHMVANILHVQVVRDDAQGDPTQAFSAVINAPGLTQVLPLRNGSALDFPVRAGNLNGTIHAEVDDFVLLPHGANAQDATAISCTIVFKLVEFIRLTIGSIPVTAALRSPV
jgi:hypothetical protein